MNPVVYASVFLWITASAGVLKIASEELERPFLHREANHVVTTLDKVELEGLPGTSGSWFVLGGSGKFQDPKASTTQLTSFGLGENTYAWIETGDCKIAETCRKILLDVTKIRKISAGKDQVVQSLDAILNADQIYGDAVGIWRVVKGTGNVKDIMSPTSAVTGLSVGENVFHWVATQRNAEVWSEVHITVTHDPAPEELEEDASEVDAQAREHASQMDEEHDAEKDLDTEKEIAEDEQEDLLLTREHAAHPIQYIALIFVLLLVIVLLLMYCVRMCIQRKGGHGKMQEEDTAKPTTKGKSADASKAKGKEEAPPKKGNKEAAQEEKKKEPSGQASAERKDSPKKGKKEAAKQAKKKEPSRQASAERKASPQKEEGPVTSAVGQPASQAKDSEEDVFFDMEEKEEGGAIGHEKGGDKEEGEKEE